ncbi:hypothetical protein D3C86_1685370 [compost metagenome]
MLNSLFGFAMEKLVGQFLEALEAEEGTAQHQQRRYCPGNERADGQRRRHQYQFVDERPLGHRPYHRQLAVGTHTGDLLGVQRQVIAQHACGLLGRHLGHQGHIVEYRGDVVDQDQQTASCHGTGSP